jgi:PAS domain-containing protein
LLTADEAATVILGIDGTPIDANAAGVALFGSGEEHEDRSTLRDVLDQVPPQLLLDPEGGVWRGEIDLTRSGGPTSIETCTVLVRHDPLSSAGGCRRRWKPSAPSTGCGSTSAWHRICSPSTIC